MEHSSSGSLKAKTCTMPDESGAIMSKASFSIGNTVTVDFFN